MIIALTTLGQLAPWTKVYFSGASTGIFGIGVLLCDNDCDKQPSYEYCGEGTEWF